MPDRNIYGQSTVTILPYDPSWAKAFEAQTKQIQEALGAIDIDFHHIGSTSIPGMIARPIIDILGVVSSFTLTDPRGNDMRRLGYEVLGEFGMDDRRYYRMTSRLGSWSYQLEIYVEGSDQIEKHIATRDYLIEHSEHAQTFAELKTELIANPSLKLDEYLNGKARLTNEIERNALRWKTQS